jgi:thymidylate kinase
MTSARATSFIILEGADGAGKSAVAVATAEALRGHGHTVIALGRNNARGPSELTDLVGQIRTLYGAADRIGLPSALLGLVAATQYRALVEGTLHDLKPGSGVVVIADSWSYKACARLLVESRRGARYTAADCADLDNWLRSLLEFPHERADFTTIMIRADAKDRQAWHESSGHRPRVYDAVGAPSMDTEDYVSYTDELQAVLQRYATRYGWPVVVNADGRFDETVAQVTSLVGQVLGCAEC